MTAINTDGIQKWISFLAGLVGYILGNRPRRDPQSRSRTSDRRAVQEERSEERPTERSSSIIYEDDDPNP